MNKTTSIVLIIIFGLVSSLLGGGIGFLYKTFLMSSQQVSPEIEKATTIIKNLTSKTVISSVAYGEVSKIEGRNVTLSFGGDNLKIKMMGDAPIYSFSNDSAGKPVQKKVNLETVKIGDTLNIAIKVLPDGQIQGQSILIIRPAPTSKP